MDVPPFALERWFAEVEHDADVMLAESGVRSLDASRFDTDPGELGYVIPTNGAPNIREVIGERHDRSADEVVCTVGTQEANYLAFQSLLSPGDHAVVVTPTYQSLHAIPDSICDVTRVPLDPPSHGSEGAGGEADASETAGGETTGNAAADWTLDLDAVADAIRSDTQLVVVNNPNNPTGHHHDEATMRALYDLAADGDAYLLGDEVYRLLAPDPVPPVASFGEYGVSTAGLSKTYGLAGLRFGWLAGPREVVEGVERWKDYTTISPGQFGHHVAGQVFGVDDDRTGPEAESREGANREADLREDAIAHVQRNREITAEWAREHGIEWPDPVGCNAFLRVPDGFADSREFCRRVVDETSVVLAPGDCFSTGGESYDDWFRLGFGLETDELRDGLQRVAGVL